VACRLRNRWRTTFCNCFEWEYGWGRGGEDGKWELGRTFGDRGGFLEKGWIGKEDLGGNGRDAWRKDGYERERKNGVIEKARAA
jgi:hypothetical protein